MKKVVDVDTLLAKGQQGDKRSTARLISMIERGGSESEATLAKLWPHTGKAKIVGVTGPPGAGKSTMTDKLAKYWRAQGLRVGIVAVDPTSPFTGSSHYITLAAADEEYLYVLDPLRREKAEYANLDPTDMLEIITPGLVRMKQSDAMLTVMSPFYLISAPEAAPEG